VERAVEGFKTINELSKRINIPSTSTSPPGLIEANTVDPFSQAGKYALGWTYFCLILVGLISITRVYHWWTDKMRQALFKDDMAQNAITYSPADYMTNMETGGTVDQLFPRVVEKSHEPTYQSSWSSIGPINDTLALFRWIFYRPIPAIRYKKHTFSFPSLAVTSILIIALAFVTLFYPSHCIGRASGSDPRLLPFEPV